MQRAPFKVVQHGAKASDVIVSFLRVEIRIIKEPTVTDIGCHGRLYQKTRRTQTPYGSMVFGLSVILSGLASGKIGIVKL
jgi:hypothetical protein